MINTSNWKATSQLLLSLIHKATERIIENGWLSRYLSKASPKSASSIHIASKETSSYIPSPDDSRTRDSRQYINYSTKKGGPK
jgi:hypothetical protein